MEPIWRKKPPPSQNQEGRELPVRVHVSHEKSVIRNCKMQLPISNLSRCYQGVVQADDVVWGEL